jgi:hypothetical protein
MYHQKHQQRKSSKMSKKVYTMSGEFVISLSDFDVLAKNEEEAQVNFEKEVIQQIQGTYLDCDIDTSVIEIEGIREDDYDEL